MTQFISNLFTFLPWLFIFYTSFVILFYLVILFISARQLRSEYGFNSKEAEEDLLDSFDTKPVSILVPAYNEEAGIYNSVRSLLSIYYPEYEVIVINDGSTDKTAETMIEAFQMVKINFVVRTRIPVAEINGIYRSTIYENVYMIDKKNGGKADALNAGINLSHYPYICSLDGDSVLERNAFLKVIKPVLDSDGEVIAVGGSVRIANGCHIEGGEVMTVGLSKKPLVVMQVIEYLRAFLIGRIGLSRHNLLLIISGAFGVFEKESVTRIGGYRTDTVGEDMDLVVRLHRMIKDRGLKKKILYVPDPVCWTEAPESALYLRRQRQRWHRGLCEVIWNNKDMLFNPKYGLVGVLSMAYFFLIELMGVFVELLGYLLILFGLLFSFISVEITVLIASLSFLYGSVLSMGGVLLEEWSLRKYPKPRDIVRLFFFALSETFWYRPLMIKWRLEGFFQFLAGKKDWGEMKRIGVGAKTEAK
ncbi:glycosyltransferase family 2 protein [Pseudobacillus badius]|uniref:glycosyltransferase family 2 protein n=1 Tax=Bacillus badius TaxID=1455 RepID=UPI0007B08F6B|nr:glycosyltransferase [Bacillus badius]KZO01818.1 glycosyl transferase [Bacillus badius]OCS90208.1 glycosyl transferase [Bacillus badius]OVE53738.1 glycosyl transferase [Bacillus badius]TDW06124.1 cellulose synthase/poly-beta-1,6-N-acetylglucosamine synthase-like glycosyltransferase [Bacillus badius]UAT32045.1 glycosyltransferase [Bacillus badius]